MRTSEFYIIAEGHFHVYHSRRDDGQDKEVVGQLGKGDCFGELALAFGVARQATVATTSAASVFVLNPEVYVKHFIPAQPPERFNSHGKILASVKLFDILNLYEKRHLGLALGEELHGSGEVIFMPGEHPKFVYILLDGSVTIQTEMGETYLVTEPGKVFGELTFQDKPLTCTAVANENGCALLVLPADKSAMLEPIKHQILQGSPNPVHSILW
jgi:CRP-like cAMP-binding protein